MPDLNRFVQDLGKAGDWLDDYSRSSGVEFMIDHQPTSVTLVQGNGTARAAQNVRLAYLIQRGAEAQSAAGQSGQNELVLIGPPTFAVARGDRFMIGTARYEVVFVDTSLPGKIEARARAVQ